MSGHFYSASGERAVQKGLYNLFVVKKGIDVKTVIECIDEYAERFKSKRKIDTLRYLLFPQLLEIVTEKTGVKFTKNKQTRNKERAEDRAFEEWNDRVISGEIDY